MDYCIFKDMAHANGELLQNDNGTCIFPVTCGFKPHPSQNAMLRSEHAWDQGIPAFPSTSTTNSFSAMSNLLFLLLHLVLLNTEDNAQPASERSSRSGQAYPRKNVPAQPSRYSLICKFALCQHSLHLQTEPFPCHFPNLPQKMKQC